MLQHCLFQHVFSWKVLSIFETQKYGANYWYKFAHINDYV